MRYGFYGIAYVVVLFLQLTFANFMALYQIRPNFLVIYLVFISLKLPRIWASAAGFLMGFVEDCIASPMFGVGAFSKTFSAYLVHLLPAEFFRTPILNAGILLFFVTLAHDFLFNWIYSFGTDQSIIFILFRIAFPGAIYTAIIGMMIKAVFPKFLQVKREQA